MEMNWMKLIVGSCINNNDYEITNSNCTLRECTSRSKNESNNPCGIGPCYWDPSDGESGKCKINVTETPTCINSAHYEFNANTMSCEEI
jgi:hypothetical protein